MKKITITVSAMILLFLMSCQNQQGQKEQKFSETKKLSDYENTEFLPTLEHQINAQKNSVYCVTLLYAWEKIRKQINRPLIIAEENDDLLLLNNSESFVNVLKSNEYSANGTINGNLITARAEFNKSLPFETALNCSDDKMIFKEKIVPSFGINYQSTDEQLKNVKIIYYKNDDNFIIKLLPKDKKHEIILFKTDKVFHSMAEMNEEILKLTEIGKNERKNDNLQWKYRISPDEDKVAIPKINFNIETNYATLEGNTFKTTDQNYAIETAWQRTAFLLDESGAKIESIAEIIAILSISVEEEEEKPHPKEMIFDKDFLILLKRTDSQNPYFGLWVVNTELMIEK